MSERGQWSWKGAVVRVALILAMAWLSVTLVAAGNPGYAFVLAILTVLSL